MFFNEVIFARSTELKYKHFFFVFFCFVVVVVFFLFLFFCFCFCFVFFASINTTEAVVFVSLYFILIDVN